MVTVWCLRAAGRYFFYAAGFANREADHRTPVFDLKMVSMKKQPSEDMAKPKNGRMELGAVPGLGLDPARFRDAMRRVAAAVHIVTTNGPAGLAGITATSVASITDEPPMMLFCINKTSPSAARMIENGVFCINTLGPSHEALADIFAGRTGHYLDERFSGGEWTKLVTGAPVLRRAAAAFDCRLVEAKSVVTHFVMIGAVEAADFGPAGGNLSYAHRKYGTV
jgi:flavin reductase